MQSEVRKVLESMRGNGWAYWFWNEIDAAERADAAKREEVTVSDVVSVQCVRCGMQILTTEYAVRCNCGTTIMVHRHNRKVDDGLRNAVTEMIDKWRTCFLPTPVAEIVRGLLTELNAIIATNPDSQPAAASEPSVTFGESPKVTLPADEHIRAIAAQAVRDAMPDVLDGLAETYKELGWLGVAHGANLYAAKLRKERGA